MKAWFLGVTALALAASALVPAARADGPRASSANHWAGMTLADPASGNPAAAPQLATVPLPGPRASSANRWAGMTTAGPASDNPGAAPHYVWQEGYSHGGQWQGSWVLVQ